MMTKFWLTILLVMIFGKLSAQTRDSKVAVLPFFDDEGQLIEDFYRPLHQALAHDYEVVDHVQFTHNIGHHEEFNHQLNRFLADADVDKRKEIKNIYSGLDATERGRFRKNCIDADYLIFTSSIHSKRIKKINGSGSITLVGKIYLVDLNSGELVREVSGKEKYKYEELTDETEAPMADFLNSLAEKLKAKME